MNKSHTSTHRNPKTKQLLNRLEQVCPACFENFGTTEAGDAHRVGGFEIDRRCIEPSSVGLIAIANKYSTPVWRIAN